ncbi:MAG: ribosomal protein S18-alanine N-acetyltransferase [Candidatus Hodarchaeota archaeon]
MWSIRPIQRKDVPYVQAIENDSFPNPWDEEFFQILAAWHGIVNIQKSKRICMLVGKEDDEIAGYIVWEEDKQELQGHIMNLAVRKISRRKGLGKFLMESTLDMLQKQGFRTCMLEVRESNLAAHALYEKLGMTRKSVETDYYQEEDAIIYIIEL